MPGLPLSFAQQRVWFLESLVPGTATFHIPVALRLSVPVDPEVLQQTLDEIVRRHETLRTGFVAIDGQPAQVVHPHTPLLLQRRKLEGVDSGELETLVAQLAQEEACRLFDLLSPPLMRALLLAVGPDNHHVLLLTMHHLICDGWSLGLLTRELMTIYEAFSQGRPSPLPEPAIQYADYAIWQHEQMEQGALDHQLEYWKTQLADLPESGQPADRPRSATAGFHGAREHLELGEPLTRELQALARNTGCTLYMVLLTAFMSLLHRYSGQRDLSIGSPFANRSRREVEDLIGFFVNTLVLRVRWEGDPTFEELLALTRTIALDAYANQDVPFEKLVEVLRPERSLGRNPLFQHMFALQNAPTVPAGPGDREGRSARLTSLEVDTSTSNFDLSLDLWPTDRGLVGRVEYSTELYDRATVKRMVEHLRNLLAAAAGNPGTRLSQLELIGAGELRQLDSLNHTRVPLDGPALIHERISRHPGDAVALRQGNRTVSYAELELRSGQLAAQIHGLGYGAGDVVAVHLEPGFELVTCALAVLKAGAASLLLEPGLPQLRRREMLADSGARALFALPEQAARLVAGLAQVQVLDPSGHGGRSRCSLPPVDPDSAAYLMFTSGSTGRPKAVAVAHRSVAHHSAWMQRCFGLHSQDCGLLKTSVAFDVSVFELYALLSAGGTVVLPEHGEHRDPATLVRLVRDHEVSILQVVPVELGFLLDQAELADCAALRHVLCGGETMPAALRDRFFPGCQATLSNAYGPTETCIDATVHTCVPGQPVDRVPIGRPIDNARAYVLDANRGRLPLGVPGELYVGGVGVALGYHRQPQLTARCFLPDPFSDEPGARMYRTGDRVRLRADGQLDFLGRMDRQVKVGGVRLELGEIEAILTGHPKVREAAAGMRGDAQRLVAWLCCEQPAPGTEELRRFVNARLPAALVPTHFVKMSSLPRTAAGKLDLQALPDPDRSRPDLEVAYVEPRGEIELLLAQLWCELLGLDQAGRHDNFFSLGGHSLMATQLVSRLRQQAGVELPLRKLFESPTIAELATAVGDAEPARADQDLRPASVQPGVARARTYPASYAQQRLWFLDQLVPDNPFYNVPGQIRLRGPLDRQALGRSLTELVRRHDALRTHFQRQGGQPIQLVGPPVPHPLPLEIVAGLTQRDREEEALRRATTEAATPFDLQQGPLFRTTLLQLADRDHMLLLTMHHIISDGWSLGVLLDELSALYNAFSQGLASPLVELPVQYPDFALWQRRRLEGGGIESQLDYWRQKLAGLSTLRLPADYQRPARASFQGGRVFLEVPEDVTRGLKDLCRRHEVTLFVALLSAFKVLLYRYTGQHDLSVGSPIAGRNRSELEPLIGFFVNMLVLRTDLAGEPTFAALLKRVRTTALDAFENQELPFEKLVEELQPDRDLLQNPITQVVFALQNASESTLGLAGLEVGFPSIANPTTRFDLAFDMWESGGRIMGRMEYRSELFEAETIQRWAQHYVALLSDIVAHPEQRIGRLNILPDWERYRLLTDFNPQPVDHPQRHCVQQLVRRQVRCHPEALAVHDERRQLSYGELDAWAARVAAGLFEAGLGEGARVAICLERSVAFVVAALGVLKAGATYVPLDPSYPTARIQLVLDDCGAGAVLTDAELVSRLKATTLPLLCVDQWSGSEGQISDSGSNSDSGPDPDLEADAYVIYTSGSTGRPKGVAVGHRSLLNLVGWHLRQYALDAHDRCTFMANPAFDASVWEIWPPLCAGASLHIPTSAVRDDPELLPAWLIQRGVSVCFLPTPLAERFLAGHLPEKLPLRVLLTGGDRLRRAPTQALPFELVNHYGPTECTVVATAGLVRTGKGGPPTIGRPIDNTRAYVLDPRQQPCPIGVPGELYIGGANVSRGYLNLPELTDSRFVPDPVAGPGHKLYRTGDRVRWLAGGELEFIERLDDQVKLRGFRIELGEIETVLAGHPGVADAVAGVTQTDAGDARLTAWVVLAAADDDLDRQLGGQWLEQWRGIYDETYGAAPVTAERDFDITGWNSSFTGKPLPDGQMRAWVDAAVGRIRSRCPRKVLEIGCGTGLLLLRLAPDCERYVGTDFSRVAIDGLRQSCAALPQVSLLQAGADQVIRQVTGSFDTVVLNSVVQYFPGVTYLVDVLEQVAGVLEDNGSIFLGDVRSLPLLRHFRACVELYRAPASMSVQELQQRIDSSMRAEKELLLNPQLFHSLASHLPGIGHACVEVKRGGYRNELSQYRYDVWLGREEPVADGEDISAADWDSEGGLDQRVREFLRDRRPTQLVVRGVPNAQLQEAHCLIQFLEADNRPRNAGDLRQLMRSLPPLGYEAETWWSLGEALGYEVRCLIANTGSPTHYDVVFRHPESVVKSAAPPSVVPGRRPWTDFANEPLRGLQGMHIVPLLRQHLEEHLPAWMVPSSFTVLDTLPLTSRGKLDRAALARLEQSRTASAEAYSAPRNAVEAVFAQLWEALLSIAPVGIDDNFFSLGGHSLLATQLMSQLRLAFGVEMPVRTLFEHPTVAEISAELCRLNGETVVQAAQAWLEVSRLSDEEVELKLREAASP